VSAPNDFPGLWLWVDAQSLALDDGTLVDSCPNRAGGAPLTQADALAQPVFRAQGLGSDAGIQFEFGDSLTLPASPELLPASGEFTLFIVAANGAPADYADASGVLTVAGCDSGWGALVDTTMPESIIVGGDGLTTVTDWTGSVDLIEAVYDGSTLRVTRNSSVVGYGPGTITFASSGTVSLGGIGTIGEAIFFDTALNDLERASIDADYLHPKWSSLPVPRPSDAGRAPESALRSLKRYVAVALGDDWEVRLSREEGAFERPFARVVQAGPANYPNTGGQFLADVIQPFAVYCYPLPGRTPDESLIAAQEAEEAISRAFLTGVELGYPRRVPLLNYDGVGLAEPGVNSRRAFLRVQDLTTQPFVDPDNNLLHTIAADVRLTWRRTTMPTVSGPVLTGFGVRPWPLPVLS
jgi:hypothetical protein